MILPRLYFITRDDSPFSHVEQVELACRSGLRLVQLRLKNRSDSEIFNCAKQVRKITKKYNTLFILNDYLDIGIELKADGVHLGQEDEALQSVFRRCPARMMIGSTANTFQEIQKQATYPISYIGLGPFRHSETKEKLSPILGVDKLRSIRNEMDEAKIDLPLYAIGGIRLDDLAYLNRLKLHGVAVSAAIAKDKQMEKNIKRFIQQVNSWN